MFVGLIFFWRLSLSYFRIIVVSLSWTVFGITLHRAHAQSPEPMSQATPQPSEEKPASFFAGFSSEANLRGFGIAAETLFLDKKLNLGLMYGGLPKVTLPSNALDQLATSGSITKASFDYKRTEFDITYAPWDDWKKIFTFGIGAEHRTIDIEFSYTLPGASGEIELTSKEWFVSPKAGVLKVFHSGFLLGTELSWRKSVSGKTKLTEKNGAESLNSNPYYQTAKQLFEEGIVGIGKGGFHWTILKLGWVF